MFQVVHQSAELWMKLIDHELTRCASLLDQDDLGKRHPLATSACHSAAAARRHRGAVHLSSADYMRIRAVLGRGSGQESPGFRRLLALPRVSCGRTLLPS